MPPLDDELVRMIRESLADPERFTIDDIRRDLEARRDMSAGLTASERAVCLIDGCGQFRQRRHEVAPTVVAAFGDQPHGVACGDKVIRRGDGEKRS